MNKDDSLEIHDILGKITDYDNLVDAELLLMTIDMHSNTKTTYEKNLNCINNNISLLEKKNYNVLNEVDAIKLMHTRNNEKYKQVNDDRLKLAKKYVDLENEFSKAKNELDEIEMKIKEYNEEIKELNKPSFSQLYLELVKGFGVEFMKDGVHFCRIRNAKNRSITELDYGYIKNMPNYKVCNNLWDVM